MSSLNQVTLVGNLGQDPVLNYTGSGTAVANLSVATQYRWKSKEGERQEITDWHRVVVWQQQAENCCQYLKKGSMVGVTGRLTTREWERDGVVRYTTEIIASNVLFLDKTQSGTNKGYSPKPSESPESSSASSKQRSKKAEQYSPPVDNPDDLPF